MGSSEEMEISEIARCKSKNVKKKKKKSFQEAQQDKEKYNKESQKENKDSKTSKKNCKKKKMTKEKKENFVGKNQILIFSLFTLKKKTKLAFLQSFVKTKKNYKLLFPFQPTFVYFVFYTPVMAK